MSSAIPENLAVLCLAKYVPVLCHNICHSGQKKLNAVIGCGGPLGLINDVGGGNGGGLCLSRFVG